MNKAKREYIIIEKKNIWDKYETNLRQKIIGHMIHLSCNKSRWRYLKKESRSYKLITVNNLTPDSACRTFFNNNIYFSAFCNAVLFNGKQLIDASNLIHYENDSAVIINDTKKVEDKKRRRDIIVRGDIHGKVSLRVTGMVSSAWEVRAIGSCTIQDQPEYASS